MQYLDDVIHPATTGQLQNFFLPVGIFLVINDMFSTEFSGNFQLVIRGGCGDNLSTRRYGEL
jgi:hexokinase